MVSGENASGKKGNDINRELNPSSRETTTPTSTSNPATNLPPNSLESSSALAKVI